MALDVWPSCVALGSPVLAYSMDELNTFVGLPEVWEFEMRWVETS
ncbi:MAG: hypothetical protein U5L03_10230 [Burkholderiaceae bacterium]|nr:hypothetical protein [Burkholderiaceae bacterium]